MISLPESLMAWGSPGFEDTLRSEVGALNNTQLPLQQGLTQSSYVSDSSFSVVVLNATEIPDAIRVKIGIFYAGVIAGSCCADDPSPLNEQTEYCELEVEINKSTAEIKITLLTTDL